MKRIFCVLAGVALLVGLWTGCEKEEDKAKASISGVVTDKETGTPLSGVMIELQPGGQQAQTTEDGTYIINRLKAGIYTVKAQKEGYVDYIREEIQLIAEQTMQLDIEMEEDEYRAESDYTVTTFGLKMEMVYVEGGEFEMGATAEQGDDANGNEKPVRTVSLDSYHIGKYEVTQGQWKAVMGTNPSDFDKGDDYPVEMVGWEDAQEFCKKLSEKTGKKYVLPTEAMWEYAAWGGVHKTKTRYAGSDDIEEVAWYWGNSGKGLEFSDPNYGTHKVGRKKANALGLYDMSGNVLEWCSDWYGAYDENDTENPQGPQSGSFRVVRGGDWGSVAGHCRVSFRDSVNPVNRGRHLGFRVAVLL